MRGEKRYRDRTPKGHPSIVNVTCSGSNGPSKKARAMGVEAPARLTRRLPILLVRLAPSWMRLAAEAKAKSRLTELATQ